MIQWSLTLTGNQIALLRAYRDREFGQPFAEDYEGKGYIVGTRTLCREGLMEHRYTLLPPNRDGCRYTDRTRSGVFLTERDKFILKMIEQDVATFLSATPRKKPSPKRDRKAAA